MRRDLEEHMAHGTRLHRRGAPGMRGRDGNPHLFSSRYACAPIGERAFFKIYSNRGKNTTLLTSFHAEGLKPSMAVEGATTARVFESLTGPSRDS